MDLIVVTQEGTGIHEASHIQHLFNAGLKSLHLRKPALEAHEFESILRQLPPACYNRIVIHSHHKLVEKYNLRGIHLPEWYMKNTAVDTVRQVIAVARKRRLTVSASVHSIQTLQNLGLKLDYVFLGPVFNSISKEGYHATIAPADAAGYLQETSKRPAVIAIGGISHHNIREVRDAGFDGAALLGAVWTAGDPTEQFIKIQTMLNT